MSYLNLAGLSKAFTRLKGIIDLKQNAADPAGNSLQLGGQLPSYYATKAYADTKLDITGTAADSALLGGQLPAYYGKASDVLTKVNRIGDTMTGPLVGATPADQTVPQFHNIVILNTAPTEGDQSPYPDGTIVFVPKEA